jgi:hypothetical protein
MAFDIDQDVAGKLKEGMTTSGAVELPFPAPTVWVVNGQNALKPMNNALYFGGFAAKTDEVEAALAINGVQAAPRGFVDQEMTPEQGQPFNALVTRYVCAAPVCTRKAWIAKDGVRTPDYVEGSRQHVQALVYLANFENKQFTPWGPAVLSAKGFQATNLLKSFDAWSKATSTLRAKHAPGVPAWCFYLMLGTFGQERKSVLVGPSGSQSQITPVGAYVPDPLTLEHLEACFVGNDVAKAMSQMLNDAADWKGAWSSASVDTLSQNGRNQANGHPVTAAAAISQAQQEDDPAFWDNLPAPGGNDIPF